MGIFLCKIDREDLPAGLHIALNVLQAFFGMKQGYYEPMWKLVDNNGNTEGVFAQTQNIGITIQVVLLLVTLGIMEALIRRKSNKNNIS